MSDTDEHNSSLEKLTSSSPDQSPPRHIPINKLKFGPQLKITKIHSDKLKLDFTAYTQDETSPMQQRCYIMTIHDLGCDHTSFEEFINCPEMKALKDRIIWIHVDLPGQEPNASDLNVSKYPCLTEVADELVCVLDHFNIGQLTCFGEGLGANVAARFAMAHPTRCLGLVLIHPTGSSASFFETAKEKLSNMLTNKNNLSHLDDYLTWHRYGQHSSQSDQLVLSNIKEFKEKLYGQRNKYNLSMLMDVFLHRNNFIEKISEIKCDVLTTMAKKRIVGKRNEKVLQIVNRFSKRRLKVFS